MAQCTKQNNFSWPGCNYAAGYWRIEATVNVNGNIWHDSSNASRGLVQVYGHLRQIFVNVSWANPSTPIEYQELLVGNGDSGTQAITSVQSWKTTGCQQINDAREGWLNRYVSYGQTNFSFWETENGNWQCGSNVDLNTNQRILDPGTLTPSVTNIGNSTATLNCTLSSWGGGQMKGTPYTSGGGRSWNWQYTVKQGSTTIKTANLNRGETLSLGAINLTGLTPGTTYSYTIVASNDYQRTKTITGTFKTDSAFGWITPPTGGSKRIVGAAVTTPDGVTKKMVGFPKLT